MAPSITHLCILMVLVLGRTALSKECGRLAHNHQRCPVYQVSSEGSRCDLIESSQRELSFFVKPGHHFRGIQVSFPVTNLHLEAQLFRDADKWYEIKVWKDAGIFLSDYFISIVGKVTRKTTFTNSEGFKVMVTGSLLYSLQCNPGSFEEQHDEVGPVPHFLTNAVKFDGGVLENNHSRPANASDENESEGDSILGYPIWVFIIACAFVLFLLIVSLATIFAMWRKKRAEKRLRSDNAASNARVRRTGSLPTTIDSLYGLEDSTSLVYEEPRSSSSSRAKGDHAYDNETELRQEDLVNQELPPNPSTDAWRVQYQMTHGQSRPPSTHDSENSLYGCVIDRTT